MFAVDKVMSYRATVSKSPVSEADKNKKKQNNLMKIKPKRKKCARERIYLGKFQDDLNFLSDFVEFQRLCQQQMKTKYTVKNMISST